jgi:hypothetical protein
MSNSRIFRGVTLAVLNRMREANEPATNKNSYAFHLNPDGKTGIISGKSSVGDVVIGFDYAETRAEVTVTILNKPMFVPAALVWAELSYALRCATEALGTPQGEDETIAEQRS